MINIEQYYYTIHLALCYIIEMCVVIMNDVITIKRFYNMERIE